MPAGELGEICFRNADGTAPPVNYFGAKEASERKTRGGWSHSGDIGWKDQAGWLQSVALRAFIRNANPPPPVSRLQCMFLMISS